MPYLRGAVREQILLLPKSIEDYVGPENPVRVIEAFVEGLELKPLGLEENPAGPGAPAYDPRAMLKLFLYGYLHRIRSSRELEKATRRNLEVIWLLRELTPDHWTINAFRRTHRPAFKGVFRQFHLLCAKLELFGRELVAVDGTFLKGVNSPARNFTQAKLQKLLAEIDERTEAYLRKLEQADRESGSEGTAAASAETPAAPLREKLAALEKLRQEYAEMLAQLAAAPGTQISQTDPDSRCLCKGGAATVGYNAQIAVEAAHHLIVVEEVTRDPNDTQQLAPMALAAQAALGTERLSVVADRGYYGIDQLQRCQEANIEAYVPAQKAARPPGFSLERFSYDAGRDSYLCPHGQELLRHQDIVNSSGRYRTYYNLAACRQCPLRRDCTQGASRRLAIHEHTPIVEAARERLRAHPEMMARRGGLVEHPFGTLKFWMGYGAFLTRGLESVRAEFTLSCLAYNLRRVLNLVSVRDLLKALGRPAEPVGA